MIGRRRWRGAPLAWSAGTYGLGIALMVSACSASGPSALDVAKGACISSVGADERRTLAPEPDNLVERRSSARRFIAEYQADLAPRIDALADAAARDDSFRPAYFAMTDLSASLDELERAIDDPAEFERIGHNTLDGIQRLDAECKLILAK
jgi:hypothetical protein